MPDYFARNLNEHARNLLNRLSRSGRPLESREGEGSIGFDAEAEAGRLRWMMPQLIELIRANPKIEIESMEPTIRQLAREYAFCNAGGDAALHSDEEHRIDRCVRVASRVLRQARRNADQFCYLESSTPMFG